MNTSTTHPDDLLAWYVNGTLDDAERQQVERHLDECARCRDEIVFLRALRQGVKKTSLDDTPGELGLKRLLRDVRSETTPRRRQWWTPALSAAAVVIVVQAALLAVLWQRPATYAPLGDGAADRATLQVRFQPEATEAQIRALLQQANAVIVEGPSALGLYRIRADETGAALAQLQTRSDVVEYVAAE